jgi:hypothetical protein
MLQVPASVNSVHPVKCTVKDPVSATATVVVDKQRRKGHSKISSLDRSSFPTFITNKSKVYIEIGQTTPNTPGDRMIDLVALQILPSISSSKMLLGSRCSYYASLNGSLPKFVIERQYLVPEIGAKFTEGE